jgi:hypothetical protein
MASIRGANDGTLLIGAMSLGAIAFYCGFKLYKRFTLSDLEAKHSSCDEIKRADALERLLNAPFLSKMETLKRSLEGCIITPDDVDMYTEARNRAFNQDVRGIIVFRNILISLILCVLHASPSSKGGFSP